MNPKPDLTFHGPFSWFFGTEIPCVFVDPLAQCAGIYLWTVPTPEGELVYYVGETGRTFGIRMLEHLKDQLCGMYHVYEPQQFRRGVKNALWTGAYGKNRERKLTEFTTMLPRIASELTGFIRMIRFHFAPLDGDPRLRKRIEAAISEHLCTRPAPIGCFQEEGVRYQPRRGDEEPVALTCYWSGDILGLARILKC